MRTMLVVMSDALLEQDPQLAFVPDDGAVKQFVTDASHPSLRKVVRSGRAGRGGDRFGPDGG